MLSNMGVTNAEEVVMDALAKKHAEVAAEKYYNANATDDLKNATISECAQFVSEADVSEQCRKALARMVLAKISANNTKIDTSSDIDQIVALANAAGAGARRIAQLKTLADTVNEVKTTLGNSLSNPMNLALYNGNKDLQKQTEDQIKKIGETINKVQNGEFDYGFNDLDAADYKKATYGGGNDTANRLNSDAKSGKDKSQKDPTTFDWMERKLTILDKQTSTLQDKIDNLVGCKAKNQVTDTVLDLLGDKLTTLEKMSARYQEQLDSIDLPEEWIEKIQSGAYDIDSLDSDKDKKLIK